MNRLILLTATLGEAKGFEMLRCAQHDKIVFVLLPQVVTLSEPKGLPRLASRCFAALSMTRPGLYFVDNRHPERKICLDWLRDASLRSA